MATEWWQVILPVSFRPEDEDFRYEDRLRDAIVEARADGWRLAKAFQIPGWCVLEFRRPLRLAA